MKAVVQTGFGGPEVFVPTDVVLRVRACALNRLDVIQQHGPAVIPGFRLPHIAGMDIAGLIVEVGNAVTRPVAGALLRRSGLRVPGSWPVIDLSRVESGERVGERR